MTPFTLVAGGAALSKIDGFPIFAMGVYPGDVAVVEIVEVKKGFARAELVRLVTPSPLRRAAPCSIAGECGGCDWTALRLDAQLEAKRAILIESLRRIGKIHSPPPIAIHPSPLNYRLRSRLHRDGDAVGFYAMRSNRVVPLASECEVVGVETARNVGRALSPSRRAESPPYVDDIWEIDGEIITGDREVKIGEYILSTGAFFQVNRHLLGTLIDLVTGHASRCRRHEHAIDLYAGVGYLSVPLARHFERVIAVEGLPLSHGFCRRNVPENVDCVLASVERWTMPDADFILLDPPRAGARPEVIDAIAGHAREMVCYLSCDPVTFARDASRLIASGWRLATLDLLDLFPNTHHVETLASFERAG